eukprot:m.488987 g.488987  ORF g.488987 m.488987 type:complete len:605 (+) comp26277_c0_seq1:1-1815(+)
MAPWSPLFAVALALAVVSVVLGEGNSSAYNQYPRSELPTQRVFVVSDSGLAPEDVVTVETLSGVLARHQPVIYRVNNDSYDTWLSGLEDRGVLVNRTFEHDLAGLLRHFAPLIKGFVRFTLNKSLESAVTFCAGTNDAVVAVGTDSTVALLKTLTIAQLADLRAVDPVDVYKTLRNNFVHHMVAFQVPSKSAFLVSYAVFSRMPWVEYIGDAGGPLADMVISDIQATGQCGVAFGWGPEQQYVHHLASHNIYVHASDYDKDLAALTNLHVHTNTPRTRHAMLANTASSASAPLTTTLDTALTPNHTVAFLMSDGDNLQWLLGPFLSDPHWFGSSQRGSVPMGWTMSPALSVLTPSVWDMIAANATANDSFIGAPSGIGYTYPGFFSLPGEFSDLTMDALATSGMRTLNVIGQNFGFGSLWPLIGRAQLDALFYYSFCCFYVQGGGQIDFFQGKPAITGRYALWEDRPSGQAVGVSGLVKQLLPLAKDPTSEGGYSLIPVHAWSHSYGDVLNVTSQLRAAGGFDIVTPIELARRVATTVCPTPRGSFGTSCSGCTVDPNTCILACASCSSPGGTTAAKCNLRCCNNLANTNGQLTCNDQQCQLEC